MSFQAIEQVLNRHIGLDAASIGAPSVARAVQNRMSMRRLEQPSEYLECLRQFPDELQALIEAVVVPETWFFRHQEAFASIGAFAARKWLANPGRPPMRLLSAPCSTGEEPYSLAMTLLDAGLPPERFRIDGIDISARALERARDGVYGKNSFRGADLDFCARHFTRTADGLSINERPRACVQFRQANLLNFEGAALADQYDAIFCRNLLIYFDGDTQRRAIEILHRLLSPDGLLYVGPGEANLMLGSTFVSARIAHAFAFRKAAADASIAKDVTVSRPAGAARSRAPAAPPAKAPAFSRTKLASTPGAPPAKKPDLAEIRRLADKGRLADATGACEQYLRREEPTADAWRLLGLLRDATGKLDGAADCYRKALYLDPGDRESLEHLALLLKRRGDLKGAERVAGRALRLQSRGAS